MALYESTIILRPDLATNEVEKIAGDFEEVISNNQGKVVEKQLLGLRELAYKVHKHKKGYYVFFGLEGNGDTILELKRKYKINENVIRDLTVNVDKINSNLIDFGDK